jgi:hypothetical protein
MHPPEMEPVSITWQATVITTRSRTLLGLERLFLCIISLIKKRIPLFSLVRVICLLIQGFRVGDFEQCLVSDSLSEWSRRQIRNLLGSARRGSNPLAVVLFSSFACFLWGY